jgi:putative transposase
MEDVLTNHLATAASIDFFTVPTVTGRVLFVLLVLSHHRRRIVHFNITEHPTATWSAQQVVDAFPDDTAPTWLHRDRDHVFGDVFRRRLARMGITEVVSAPASPWQNPFVERLIGSIRRECLDHVIVLDASHLRRLLTTYSEYKAKTYETAANGRVTRTTRYTAPPRHPSRRAAVGSMLAARLAGM